MDEQIRTLVRDSLDLEPHPGLRARVMASIPPEEEPRHAWRWALPAVAVVVAVAMVLLLTRPPILSGSRQAAQPSRLVDRGQAELVSADGLQCRLPIIVEGSGQTPMVGFLSLPGGRLLSDPSAKTGDTIKVQPTVYDAGLDRWVATNSAVGLAPDGKSYAVARMGAPAGPGQKGTLTVAVVDVPTARETQLWSGLSSSSTVVAFYNGLVYFIADSTLYAADPGQPGNARTVAAGLPPYLNVQFGAGGLWYATGRPDPSLVKLQTGKQVVRFDLRDGTETTQFTAADGEYAEVVAIDAQGRALLRINSLPRPVSAAGQPVTPAGQGSPPPRYVVLTAPDRTVALSLPAGFSTGYGVTGPQGVWLASGESIWLWSGTGMREVARVHYSQLWTQPVYSAKPAPDGAPTKPGAPAAATGSGEAKSVPQAVLRVAGACA